MFLPSPEDSFSPSKVNVGRRHILDSFGAVAVVAERDEGRRRPGCRIDQALPRKDGSSQPKACELPSAVLHPGRKLALSLPMRFPRGMKTLRSSSVFSTVLTAVLFLTLALGMPERLQPGTNILFVLAPAPARRVKAFTLIGSMQPRAG